MSHTFVKYLQTKAGWPRPGTLSPQRTGFKTKPQDQAPSSARHSPAKLLAHLRAGAWHYLHPRDVVEIKRHEDEGPGLR